MAMGAFVVDVITKALGVALLSTAPIRVGRFVTFHVVRNRGVEFGIGSGVASGLILAVTGVVAALVAIAGWRGTIATAMAAGLIVGGATANLLDRAVGGQMVDLMDLGWWPAFKFADSSIVLVVPLLAVSPRHGHRSTHVGRPASKDIAGRIRRSAKHR